MFFSDRIRLFFLGLMFSLVLVVGVHAGARLIYAFAYNAEAANDERVKCYESVMIYLGDTVYSIAEENAGDGYDSVQTYANEVARINHINVDTPLIPGNYLVVPYYKPLERP